MNTNAITKYSWISYTAIRSNLAYLGEVLSRTTFMAVILYTFMRLWSAVAGSRTRVACAIMRAIRTHPGAPVECESGYVHGSYTRESVTQFSAHGLNNGGNS